MLYFDHNAATPVAAPVEGAFAEATREIWGNASSIHSHGQIARRKLESARQVCAAFLGCAATEFVFTSGGTEANNLAILGLVRNLPEAKKHVVTSSMEHPSVLEACKQLEREGVAVSYVDGAGRIASELRDSTVLVSVMHANNETGAVQPLPEFAALMRERRAQGQRIWFHSDGVQALGKIPVRIASLGVDLYSVSAHKVYAPKGTGGLFVSKGTPLHPIQFGGRHERERRPGTENVVGAIAFARALELCEELPSSALRDGFERDLRAVIPEIRINAADGPRLPNTSNVLFPGVSGEALVIALDTRGIAVSSGSACSSGSTEPSHVLLAMGLSKEEARSSVRFSFGRGNTREDIEALVDAVAACVARLRRNALKEMVYG